MNILNILCSSSSKRRKWYCFSLRLALSVNAGNSPNRRDCHCRYSLFCGHSSSLGKLFLQFHGVVLNQTWVSNALLWLHHDAIAHDLIHGWGTEASGLIISASHFTGIFHSYLLPLFHKETRSPKLGQQSMWSPELAGTRRNSSQQTLIGYEVSSLDNGVVLVRSWASNAFLWLH